MKEHLLLAVFVLCGGILLLLSLKKYKLRFTVLSALLGAAALAAADLMSGFFDFNIPLNAFTLAVSALGGIPGVILLNVLSVLMK